jgi:hypothetical protein
VLIWSSTSTSFRWQVPLWRKIADHGRACCDITSLQSLQGRHITRILRYPCRMLFNLPRRAPIIPALHYLRCYRRTRRFLGLVIPQVLPYLKIRTICAERKFQRLFPACENRRMDRSFWHLSPTRVPPAYNTIILHPHTLLNIIGAADVAFNRLCCSCHVFCLMPRARYEL